MRAVVCDRYGGPDVLRIEDVEKPLPKDDEVLVRIYAVAVTRADCATRSANRRSGRGFELVSRAIFGLRRPRQPILGGDFSGVVEAVGRAVKEFAVGDDVFGSSGIRFGAYAEFVSRPESSRITRKTIWEASCCRQAGKRFSSILDTINPQPRVTACP